MLFPAILRGFAVVLLRIGQVAARARPQGVAPGHRSRVTGSNLSFLDSAIADVDLSWPDLLTASLPKGLQPMKLYRLNVTANGEPSAIFAIAEDVDSLFHALEDQDHGEADEESLLAYYDGDKKPRVIRSLEDVP